jgi:predicted ATP-dependent serine protease
MKKCPSCGYESDRSEMKCPVCGAYYSKIIELIAEEEANEEKSSFRGRWRCIRKSENVRHELLNELKAMYANLTGKAKFTLFVIFIFVFALIVSVL